MDIHEILPQLEALRDEQHALQLRISSEDRVDADFARGELRKLREQMLPLFRELSEALQASDEAAAFREAASSFESALRNYARLCMTARDLHGEVCGVRPLDNAGGVRPPPLPVVGDLLELIRACSSWPVSDHQRRLVA